MSTTTVIDGTLSGEFVYLVGPDTDMARTVRAGEVIRLRTMDSSGNQMREGMSFAELDTDRIFPVTGPLRIDGVRAGDAVGVEIRALTLGESGHTWTRPGLGFGVEVPFHVRRVDIEESRIEWVDGVSIPVASRPHVGTVGVLPHAEQVARTLGGHGGNLDFADYGVGAIAWLTAQVEGAGVFLGDVHAAMGDGEVCGTGLETSAELEIVIHHRTDWAPEHPTVEVADKLWLIAVADDLEEALAVGVRACTEAVRTATGMPLEDAYLATGLLLENRICQVVNPRASVAVSLGGEAHRMLGWKHPA